jgi:leucyl/phenylalanyl-tRNA--protein transferase
MAASDKVTAMRKKSGLTLPWLEAGDPFPPIDLAWGPDSEAPGLLAAGGQLDVPTLRDAYANGIFPWFSDGQPILWWSPDPRMVLQVENFRLHHSLRKTIRNFIRTPGCEIRFDSNFARVIRECAGTPRDGTNGTWIVPSMERAYIDLHLAGYAHSVETWIEGELVGGLYCVSLGKAVFGESMFSKRSDASKIALAALTCFCKTYAIAQIDCQQNTRHLASMGAAETTRSRFLRKCNLAMQDVAPIWDFDTLYWQQLLPERPADK